MANINRSTVLDFSLSFAIIFCLSISAYFGFFNNTVIPGEGPGVWYGDKTCTNDPAKTLFEINPQKKFNENWYCVSNKPSKIDPSIEDKDLPLLFGYPSPSFRYGAAILTGAITHLFPNSLFRERYSRPLFANFLATIGILILLTTLLFNKKISSLLYFSIVIIFVTDISYYYNSNIYGSHTIPGIFFTTLSASLIGRKSAITNFLLGTFLCLSLLSSSHLLFLNVLLVGFLIYSSLKSNNFNIKNIFLWILGFSLPLAHLYFIERIYLPKNNYTTGGTFFDQQRNMVNAIDLFSNNFPFFDKVILDPLIFNPLIFAPLVIFLIFYFFKKSGQEFTFKFDQSSKFAIFLMLLGAASFLMLWPKSIPVSRAFVINSILIQCGLLFYLVSRFSNENTGKIFLLVISILFVAMFNLRVLNLDNTKTFFDYTHKNIKLMKDDNAYSQIEVNRFYNTPGDKAPQFRFAIGDKPNNSIGIPEFLKVIDNDPYYHGARYIKFDPLNQIYPYLAARRNSPSLQINQDNVINRDTLLGDYRLFFSLLEADPDMQIFITADRPIFRSFSTWDLENNYQVLHSDHINLFFNGTKYSKFDISKIYYFDVEKLKDKFAPSYKSKEN